MLIIYIIPLFFFKWFPIYYFKINQGLESEIPVSIVKISVCSGVARRRKVT